MYRRPRDSCEWERQVQESAECREAASEKASLCMWEQACFVLCQNNICFKGACYHWHMPSKPKGAVLKAEWQTPPGCFGRAGPSTQRPGCPAALHSCAHCSQVASMELWWPFLRRRWTSRPAGMQPFSAPTRVLSRWETSSSSGAFTAPKRANCTP